MVQIDHPTIVLMTRWPAINRCKSRLSKEIGALNAAKIQEQLILHTIAVVKDLREKGLANIKVAIDGVGINAAKRWASLNNIEKVAIQGSGNLGTKMKRQFLKTSSERTISDQRASPIVLIGADLPTISQIDLVQAIEILKHSEMVIGPSTDGGYWLIGFSKEIIHPQLLWPFSGIKWGTNQVFQETIRLAELNQINYQLLQEQNDLDNFIDLSPWINYKSFQLSASSYQL